MALQIHTLGPFSVFRDGERISDQQWKSQKNKNLFKILLTHWGHALTKDQLMEWLWHDVDPQAAGRNLRVAVSQLRKTLEPGLDRGSASQFIATTAAGYAINTEADMQIDVIEFETACKNLIAALPASTDGTLLDAAEQIRAKYTGTYLEEDRYEDWAMARREEVDELYYNLLSDLAEVYARLGQYRRAITTSRDVLSIDPLREAACKQVMLYLYLSGETSDAIRTYERFSNTLRDQLDIEPTPSLNDLYEQIRENRLSGLERQYPAQKKATREIPYSLSPESTPFVGRSGEIKRLDGLLEKAQSGQGSLVLIGGEAGVGKTRFVREWLSSHKEKNDFTYFDSASHEFDLNLSYMPWRRVLEKLIRSTAPDLLSSLDPKWLGELIKLSPQFRTRFAEIEPNPILESDQQLSRFHASIMNIVRHVANARQPLIFYFDDMHWWDEESQELLQHMSAHLSSLPVLLICTFREGETDRKQISNLAVHNSTVHFSLERLSAQDVRSLIGDLPFPESAVGSLASDLSQETEGNPLFIISTLQHLFEEEQLVIEDRQWIKREKSSESVSAPLVAPSIQDAISQRISKLSEDELELIRLASTFGSDWNLRLIQSAWHKEQSCLSTTLNLVDAQLISERGLDYQFSHPKIREVVDQEISPALSQILHKRVLHALETDHAGQLELLSARLTHHAIAACDWQKAIEYALMGTRRARASFHLREAIRIADQGLTACQKLDIAEKTSTSALTAKLDLLEQKAATLRSLGKRDEEVATLEEMQSIAKKAGHADHLACSYRELGNLHSLTGQFQSSIENVQQAIELFKSLDNKTEVGICLKILAHSLHQQGNTAEALDAIQQSISIHKELGDQIELGHSLLSLGNINFFTLAEYDKAKSNFEQAYRMFVDAGQTYQQARALNNLGNVTYFALMKYEEAVEYYKQALEIFRAIGDRYGEGMATNNIGNVYRNIHLGKVDEAKDFLSRSIEICQEIDDQVGEAISMSGLGKIEASLGNYREAIEIHKRAREISSKIDHLGEKSGALFEIGTCHFSMGNYGEALESTNDALQICEQIEDERGIGFCSSLLGDIYRLMGRWDEARDCYQRAQSLQTDAEIYDELISTLNGLALLSLSTDLDEQAESYSQEANELLESLEHYSEPQEIYFTRYQTLSALGQQSKADVFLEKARSSVNEIANQLPEKYRNSYLDQVPINREILQA